MRHPDEQTIERIAVALAESGFSREWDRASHVPVDLAPSLDHVRRCTHCREILEILIATEAAWRSPVASRSRIIQLHPFRKSALTTPAPEAIQDEETERYPVAAADESTRPTQTRVLTLMTEDDRFLVRVFPDETGGATAILVSLPSEGAAATDTPRPVLRFAGADYEFDDTGIARLPDFPSSEVVLVIHDAH